jgi:H-NS histone family
MSHSIAGGRAPLEEEMALKTLSIDKLVKLKGQIDAALASKVTEQRRELELELSKLNRFQGGKSRGGLRGGRGAVAPKYRNPENTAETWAGARITASLVGGGRQIWQEARRLRHSTDDTHQAGQNGQTVRPAVRHEEGARGQEVKRV